MHQITVVKALMMAKDKNKSTELKDCAKCASVLKAQNTLYCTLRLQDVNILQDSGKVTKQDCIWFKERLEDGTK